MDPTALRELDYGFNMAVQALITALGMMAENQQRAFDGDPPTYTEKDFQKVIEQNGIYHNAVLTRWQTIPY